MSIPIYAAPPLLASFAFFSLGLLVILDKPLSFEKIIFSVLCIETFNWEIVWFVSFLLKDEAQIDFLAKFAYVSITFLPFTFYHFIAAFLREDGEKRYIKLCYGLALILVCLLFPTDLFVRGHRHFSWGNFAAPGLLYPLFMISGLTVMIRGLFLLTRAARAPDRYRLQKGQVQCLLLGLGFYFFCALDFLQVYGFPWYPIGTVFFILSYSLISYALVRYQILDLEKIAEAFQREKLAAIGVIAASVNHEVRSPLFVAKGALESYLQNMEEGLYKKEDLPSISKKTADVSLQQISRAVDIMQKLTDFAKPSVGRDRLEIVSLSTLFTRILELVKFHFDLSRIHVSQEIPSDLAIWGCRRELEEIFFNLTLNACQAMKGKGGELRITSNVKRGSITQNGTVEVRIRDSGDGIPKTVRHRLFQPFSTSREQGTGLGLYITKQLVERNGGKIKCETSPNGTTFILQIRSASRDKSGQSNS